MNRKTTKIDLHVHTKGSDGWGSPDEIASKAVERGLDAIVITDHHNTWTKEGQEVMLACREYGVMAFPGCEYSTKQGHVLIIGVAAEDLKLGWYPEIQLVVNRVLAAGGVAIPAHPYHGYKTMLGNYLFQMTGIRAVETRNGQCEVRSPRENERTIKVAKQLKLKGCGGSDAHSASYVGCCYTEFSGIIDTERKLVRALRRGSFRAVRNMKAVESLSYRAAIQFMPGFQNTIPLASRPEMRQVWGDGKGYEKPATKEKDRTFENWKREFYGQGIEDPFFYSDGSYSYPSSDDGPEDPEFWNEDDDGGSDTDPGSYH